MPSQRDEKQCAFTWVDAGPHAARALLLSEPGHTQQLNRTSPRRALLSSLKQVSLPACMSAPGSRSGRAGISFAHRAAQVPPQCPCTVTPAHTRLPDTRRTERQTSGCRQLKQCLPCEAAQSSGEQWAWQTPKGAQPAGSPSSLHSGAIFDVSQGSALWPHLGKLALR